MTTDKSRWKRWLTAPLIVLASLLIWIEETLWEGLKWLTAKIALLAWVKWIESQVRRLPPYAAIVVFFLPLTILLPFKLVAVYWMSKGYWIRSLLVIIAAKLLGTAIEARMFVLCKPQLMTFVWFRRLHDWLLRIRDQIHAALLALPVYQRMRAMLFMLKQAGRLFLLRIKTAWHNLKRPG